ncbi:hypothetical protein [Sediminicola sp. 1XM1-17]|uniref:hypothetical protein n=1 Tax=Sediminicola sp. 1XM1-17 TaxID=3127702 RepID=UPI003078722E
MKYALLVMLFVGLISCKEEKKTEQPTMEVEETTQVEQIDLRKYPQGLVKIFDAHGGLQNWRNKKSLVYQIPKPEGAEIHTTNLYSRKDKVEGADFSMGFDGKQVWLLDSDNTYKGDPVFYHNLMFYFYAMPFVLADDGIVYGDSKDVVFEGKTFPGISISYNPGVGTSYKDEYFIHYDPETFQMAWLGYTVSYRSGEKSDHVKWIRYNDWMKVSDVVLPKSISWYSYEGKTMKESQNTVPFENVILSETAKPDSFFEKPGQAKFVEGKVQE